MKELEWNVGCNWHDCDVLELTLKYLEGNKSMEKMKGKMDIKTGYFKADFMSFTIFLAANPIKKVEN